MIPLKRVFFTAFALYTTTIAQIVEFTNNNFNDIAIGAPFLLTWSGNGLPVNITLLTGTSTATLLPVYVITTNNPSTSLTLTPPAMIPPGTYALEITQAGNAPDYSPLFTISAAGTVVSMGAISFPSSAAPTAVSSAPTPPYPTPVNGTLSNVTATLAYTTTHTVPCSSGVVATGGPLLHTFEGKAAERRGWVWGIVGAVGVGMAGMVVC